MFQNIIRIKESVKQCVLPKRIDDQENKNPEPRLP